jgi:hypothetical protein
MLHLLDLHDRFVRRRRKHSVVAVAPCMIEIHRTAERLGPKARGSIDVRDIAIDQHGAQAGMMHVIHSINRNSHKMPCLE